MQQRRRKSIFVSFDIEKSGPFPTLSKIVSIGYCVADTHGNVSDKGKFNIDVVWPTMENGRVASFGDFDENCWKRFWMKQNHGLLTKLKENTITEAEAANKLRSWLDSLENMYPIDSFDIVFLSDNPSFDIGSLDILLERHCEVKTPLRFAKMGAHREIVTVRDLRTIPVELYRGIIFQLVTQNVPHDHDPENDAHFILLKHLTNMRIEAMANTFTQPSLFYFTPTNILKINFPF